MSLRKPNKKVFDNLRLMIINNFSSGTKVRNISRILDINVSTVYKIIRVYDKERRTNRLSRDGNHNCKITIPEKQEILRRVEDEPCITLESLKEYILAEFTKKVSLSTIHRILYTFRDNIKRLIFVPERRNTEEDINIWKDYAENFLDIFSEEYEL